VRLTSQPKDAAAQTDHAYPVCLVPSNHSAEDDIVRLLWADLCLGHCWMVLFCCCWSHSGAAESFTTCRGSRFLQVVMKLLPRKQGQGADPRLCPPLPGRDVVHSQQLNTDNLSKYCGVYSGDNRHSEQRCAAIKATPQALKSGMECPQTLKMTALQTCQFAETLPWTHSTCLPVLWHWLPGTVLPWSERPDSIPPCLL
jgi:hypothetical protein